MTVKELIYELLEYDLDADVRLADDADIVVAGADYSSQGPYKTVYITDDPKA